MRVRSLIVASVAIEVLVCSAVVSMPAFAQDNPAAPPADATPAVTPGAASPAGAPPPTVVQTTPEPVAATPVVESIRTKLAGFDKTSSSDDVSALVAFYNERGEPLWMTDMGFSGQGLAVVDEIRRADDWGLASSAFDLPPTGDLPASPEGQRLQIPRSGPRG